MTLYMEYACISSRVCHIVLVVVLIMPSVVTIIIGIRIIGSVSIPVSLSLLVLLDLILGISVFDVIQPVVWRLLILARILILVLLLILTVPDL